ncbi:Ribosomal-protein-alanine acetyltransferase [Actinoplanes sp. SE50]|uniref:GNAT family N-acetyltransferase n=1 Tax=unclassified Actinoplanes TaxID=2626549 RepID=UPI00023EC242|nr:MULTISPECIES: GNAT family protein [unclassified Actinoplanes]AEV83017.1 Ribosomal-protein-alanine acetyltransferase [Actinoplanes sp. SE50/110]ATO81413.1 Ribosomal-protein-alanine acetyltransferase [Actinoplanes sp. SE50]SLL98820.1 ribosomal-protein-alanine acetyltransferase [Actinoplanes sp. SE50/110]
MPITSARFVWPIGDGLVLMPRTPAIAIAYHALLAANHARLALWSPGLGEPTPEGTRTALATAAAAWLAGTRLPLAIGVPTGNGHNLVGATNLTIDAPTASAELGFWVDAAAEGRGIVSRTLHAVLDHAFGDLGLHRVEMRTLTTNHRSHRLADRLGFLREGVLRDAVRFPDGPRDVAVYALLAKDFTPPAAR